MDFPRESWELMETLADADPTVPTACSQWTVHAWSHIWPPAPRRMLTSSRTH